MKYTEILTRHHVTLNMHFISCEQEFAMVDVKTEGKERETDDLKAKLEEEGKLITHLFVSYKGVSQELYDS